MEFADPPGRMRKFTRYHTAIHSVSIHTAPLEPISPSATLMLFVFSKEPIRVRCVKTLKTKY